MLFRSSDSHQQRPNVVILLADDLGSKDIGCYGGPVKTPALDELAAKGVRFTDFHAGAAVCSPSRATLITGRQHLRRGAEVEGQDALGARALHQADGVDVHEALRAGSFREAV